MGYFNYYTIGVLLIDLAMAVHVVRNGSSPLWLLGMAASSFLAPALTPLVWLAYLFMVIVPGWANSHGARRFADTMVKTVDPGRSWREKKRQVEMVGSTDAKRALAEESLKLGLHAEAVELYQSAMQGPLGESDPALLKGMARAKLLSGDAAGSESYFLKLKALDPAAFDSDCELDYARALEEQGRIEDAARQYESVVTRYPGEEARVRFGLLLEKMGQDARAQSFFREVVESVRGAPRYYRARQGEWLRIARQHLR